MARQPSSSKSDADLVACIRSGDRSETAFMELYERHALPLLKFLAARAGKLDVEDLAQEIWRKACAHFREPAPVQPEHFRGWLFTIAHNLLNDRFRRQRPTESITDDRLADKAPQPWACMLDRERMTILSRCVSFLEPSQVQVFQLRLEGIASTELANRLNLTPAAIHSLFFKAKKQISECVQRALS